MECDFITFLCGSCDYSGNFATIITQSAQICVSKITFHFLQCSAFMEYTGICFALSIESAALSRDS